MLFTLTDPLGARKKNAFLADAKGGKGWAKKCKFFSVKKKCSETKEYGEI